jgi:ferredoxin-NADP reductase
MFERLGLSCAKRPHVYTCGEVLITRAVTEAKERRAIDQHRSHICRCVARLV